MRGLFSLIFFGLSMTAQGRLVDYSYPKAESNSIDCGSHLSLPEIKNDISSFADYMLRKNHYSYKTKQIKDAFCSNNQRLTSTEVKKALINNSTNEKIMAHVFGMDLVDDPELIEQLEKLLKVEGNVAPWIALPQKKFRLPKDCTNAVCAAEEIFGRNRGPKILYAMKKYGVNLSHLRRKDTDAWKEQEVDLILEALDDLPKALMPFKDNLRLVRNTRGLTPDGNYANAQIMVFDSFEEKSKYGKIGTLIHEIGHRVGEIGKVEETPEWKDLSKWQEKGKEWTPMNDSFIGMYAKTNPFEDFAETFVAYRYNPKTLKEVSPEKYAFMKNYIFQGLEYDSPEKCDEINSFGHKADVKDDEDEYLGIAVCREEALAVFKGYASADRMRICSQRARLDLDGLNLAEGVNSEIVKYTMQNTGAYKKDLKVDLSQSYMKLFKELSNKLQEGEADCRQIRDYANKRDKRYSKEAFLSSSFTFSPRSDIDEYSISACRKFGELESLSNEDELRKRFINLIPALNSD